MSAPPRTSWVAQVCRSPCVATVRLIRAARAAASHQIEVHHREVDALGGADAGAVERLEDGAVSHPKSRYRQRRMDEPASISFGEHGPRQASLPAHAQVARRETKSPPRLTSEAKKTRTLRTPIAQDKLQHRESGRVWLAAGQMACGPRAPRVA